METYTIKEAAERCGVSVQAMRKRVDRGQMQVIQREDHGVRRIPQSELERVGLWPLKDELAQLRAEHARLQEEVSQLRQLPQQVAAEREARERIEQAYVGERAEREAERQAREAALERQRAVQEALEEALTRELEERERLQRAEQEAQALATAGFFKRRRLLRERRERAGG